MGYTFVIGNARPVCDKDEFPVLSARWEVERVVLDSAPNFENDVMTGKSNGRSPSYGVWADFCNEVGLYDFFFNEFGRLHAGHPGCIGITASDVELVKEKLEARRLVSVLPPGFEDLNADFNKDPNFDYHLARLEWLYFWMDWAVKNCEVPAIQNY